MVSFVLVTGILGSDRAHVCDTGVVFVTGVWVKSKVIRLLSIIHNGIILDLMCGFGGSVW